MFIASIASLFDEQDQATSAPWLNRLLFGGLSLLFVSIVLVVGAWPTLWLVRRITASGGHKVRFRDCFIAWTVAVTYELILAALVTLLVDGAWLSRFDRDFLAFLVTICAAPPLLWFGLRRRLPAADKDWTAVDAESHQASHPTARLLLTAYSFLVAPAAGCVGLGLAVLTIAVTGAVPTPLLETVLTAELAPLDVLGRATISVSATPEGELQILPFPVALRNVFRPPWQFEAQQPEVPPRDDFVWNWQRDPNLPVTLLKRIEWPTDGRPQEGTHYSIDGAPAY